jgi:hypothetical protein
MQSMTVFLLELSLGGIHLTMKRSLITDCVDKLMRWLQSMVVNDAVSERAYQLLLKVLNTHDHTTLVNSSEHARGKPAQSYPPRPQATLREAPPNNTEQASAFNLPPATYDMSKLSGRTTFSMVTSILKRTMGISIPTCYLSLPKDRWKPVQHTCRCLTVVRIQWTLTSVLTGADTVLKTGQCLADGNNVNGKHGMRRTLVLLPMVLRVGQVCLSIEPFHQCAVPVTTHRR